MINRLSDMVVFDENGSEWVASEVLEPISEACESVQKGQIKLKEKLKKLGVNSKDAALIEKECRDLLSCGFLSSYSISPVRKNRTPRHIEERFNMKVVSGFSVCIGFYFAELILAQYSE